MKKKIWEVTKQVMGKLFTSAKFWLTATAAIVWLLGRLKWNVPPEDILPAVGMIMTLVTTIGLADLGKEKAKIDSAIQGAKDKLAADKPPAEPSVAGPMPPSIAGGKTKK